MNSQRNLAVFLAGTDLENEILKLLHRKGQKNVWTKLSSLGEEPTFKNIQQRNVVHFLNKNFIFQIFD